MPTLTLYELCLKVLVENSCTKRKFCMKEFRMLPNHVLFDLYNMMHSEKKLCLLSLEFEDITVFKRILGVKHKREQLLRNFQSLVDHCSNVAVQLIHGFTSYCDDSVNREEAINFGLRLGGFFSEGGWFQNAISVLVTVERLCLEMCSLENSVQTALSMLLDCYYKRIYVESYYCINEAVSTLEGATSTIEKLKRLNMKFNLAGLYSDFSFVHFQRSDYNEAYYWSVQALKELNEDLSKKVIIDVLRQAAKSCIMKRQLPQANLLIRQAMSLADELYSVDQHPRYADTLIDYGFFLLNFDCVRESVKMYEKALNIRKKVFGKNNLLVAMVYEDLAYAQYVKEYNSGNFYQPRDNAERSIRVMEKLMPKDHWLIASAKRVNALILEEIALDMRDNSVQDVRAEMLRETESLHKDALSLSLSIFGEENVHTAKHYGNLGRLYQTMSLYSEAEMMQLRSISIKEQLLGPDDYEVGLSVGHLASLYGYHMNRHKEAESLYLRSIDISLRLFGDTYSGLEYDYRGLMNVYTELLDTDKMAEYSVKMREWREKREVLALVAHSEKPGKLSEVLDKFFNGC